MASSSSVTAANGLDADGVDLSCSPPSSYRTTVINHGAPLFSSHSWSYATVSDIAPPLTLTTGSDATHDRRDPRDGHDRQGLRGTIIISESLVWHGRCLSS